ncbi:DNA-binding protein [Vogesella facilis]|uniref:DNA-binding protein n=1 Tax=Vogesella facilis TaxID=1655232 RepID=A0ABV7RBH0_9NEIS
MKTPEQVRAEFLRRGISISEWSRKNGYSAALVYQILRGGKSCLRGQSHEIAVKLGIKPGIVCDIDEFSAELAAEALKEPAALLG